jgi:hypothetical protein
MEFLNLQAGPYIFRARLQLERAPRTCEWFLQIVPLRRKLIHVRWSGEAVWTPLLDVKQSLNFENHTCHPSRGDVLFYPGGLSEPEILLAYGSCSFASKMGSLAGNHFLTLVEGQEKLEDLGRLILWEGAQDVLFSVA